MAVNPANILDGFRTVTATLGATTLITVPQGRTWSGYLSASVTCGNNAGTAVQADAVCQFSTAGTNVIPAAGAYTTVKAFAGANAAGGLVGNCAANSTSVPFAITAPAANTVIIQVTYTLAGDIGRIDAFAIGQLQ